MGCNGLNIKQKYYNLSRLKNKTTRNIFQIFAKINEGVIETRQQQFNNGL